MKMFLQEIRPWTHMMEVPQLHGFGPAANRLLEAYNMLLKVTEPLLSLIFEIISYPKLSSSFQCCLLVTDVCVLLFGGDSS